MELASLRSRCVSLEEEADAASSAHAAAAAPRPLRCGGDFGARAFASRGARARAAADATRRPRKPLRRLDAGHVLGRGDFGGGGARRDCLRVGDDAQRLSGGGGNATDATRAAAGGGGCGARARRRGREARGRVAGGGSLGARALRRAYVVHAAAKQTWAAEKIGLIEAPGATRLSAKPRRRRGSRVWRAPPSGPGPRGSRRRSLPCALQEPHRRREGALLSPGAAARALPGGDDAVRGAAPRCDAARADAERRGAVSASRTVPRSAVERFDDGRVTLAAMLAVALAALGLRSRAASNLNLNASRRAAWAAASTSRAATGTAIKNDVGGELADLRRSARSRWRMRSAPPWRAVIPVDADYGRCLNVAAGVSVECAQMVKYRGDSERARRLSLRSSHRERTTCSCSRSSPKPSASPRGRRTFSAVLEGERSTCRRGRRVFPSEAFDARHVNNLVVNTTGGDGGDAARRALRAARRHSRRGSSSRRRARRAPRRSRRDHVAGVKRRRRERASPGSTAAEVARRRLARGGLYNRRATIVSRVPRRRSRAVRARAPRERRAAGARCGAHARGAARAARRLCAAEVVPLTKRLPGSSEAGGAAAALLAHRPRRASAPRPRGLRRAPACAMSRRSTPACA